MTLLFLTLFLSLSVSTQDVDKMPTDSLTEIILRNYNVPMRTRIVKIGNSLGVRIPKLLLEKSRLAEDVEIEAFDRQIVIRSIQQPRDGWDAAFQAMAQNGDDALIDDAHSLSSWDGSEWQW